MPKFIYRDPSQPIKMPFWRYLHSLACVLAHRTLPLKWLIMILCAARRIKFRIRPKGLERTARLMDAAMPGGIDRRKIKRYIALSRTIRRIGLYSYAPVFGRSREWLLRKFSPEGLEHLDAAKRAGRGAIILGSNSGLKLWVAPILWQLGYPVHPMQRALVGAENLLLMRWDGMISEILPFPQAHESGMHLKRLYDLLKRGEWIQHVGHHIDTKNGAKARLLGSEVRCLRPPWVLARLTGAPVIPAVVLMDEDYNVRLVIGSPIHVEGGASSEDSMTSGLQSFLDFVTQHVFRVPWNLIVSSYWEALILPEEHSCGTVLPGNSILH